VGEIVGFGKKRREFVVQMDYYMNRWKTTSPWLDASYKTNIFEPSPLLSGEGLGVRSVFINSTKKALLPYQSPHVTSPKKNLPGIPFLKER